MVVGIVVTWVVTVLSLKKRINALSSIKRLFMPLQKIFSLDENNTIKSLYVKNEDGPLDLCKIFQKKETVLLGISMGNSYFSTERMRLIFSGFSSLFDNVAVLLADKLAVHNYRVMGYSENKIHRKIRENSNHARNKIKKTIAAIEQDQRKNNIAFYQWEEVERFEGYHRSIEKMTALYEHDTKFAKEINQIVLHVMGNFISSKMDQNSVINEAKWYFLKELAFIHSSSAFFNTSVVSAYYRDFPLFNRKIMHELEDISFVTYSCEEESLPS